MKVILYVNSFLPATGGKEVVIHYLAKSLQGLGHDVRVLGPGGWWTYRHLSFPYPVHRCPTLRGALRERLRLTQLHLALARWGGDVIHAHSTYPNGYTCARYRKHGAVPYVVTPHGADINVVPEIGFGLRLDKEISAKIEEALSGASVITAISRSVESSLLDAGATQEKIRAVPNGVDLDRFRRRPDIDARQWLKFPPDVRLIVTVGNFHPCKGQEVLVRAMPKILGAEPRARLVVVGRGTDALNPLIKELGLGEFVALTGGIPFPSSLLMSGYGAISRNDPDIVASLLQSSEVYVSAGMAEGAEGLSLAVLEGMGAGLPVVATRISGNADVVLDGENGVLVAPGDPQPLAEGILMVLKNRELRARMSDGASKTAQSYEWREIARRYVEVYEEARQRTTERAA